MAGDLIRSDYSRLFFIENGAGPAYPPSYESLWRAGALSWGQGDVTNVYKPSPDQYGQFVVIDRLPGEPSAPSLVVHAKYTFDRSKLLRVVKNGCNHDLQLHMGKCKDPRDFNGGWEKLLILEGARISDYGTEDLGALGPSERSYPNEDVTFNGTDLYEIVPLVYALKAATDVAQEVVDVDFCDKATCGACGLPSNGCQIIFALTVAGGGSPGAAGALVYSDDGGATWSHTHVAPFGATSSPSKFACVGTNVIVVSNAACLIAYAPTADILTGTETWASHATGLVCPAGAPNAIFSVGPTFTWIVGNGGYVYFASDPASLVEVQDAGSATAQNLNAIHGIDEMNLVAVGANNAVIHTQDGGIIWSSVTGPAPAVALTAVWMKSKYEWFVGTAGGNLYYTRDYGVTWTLKAFPGSGAGAIKDIKFSTPSVGYMAHNTATPAGRILRTLDGGYSWYVTPEGTTNIPTNQGLNALGVCADPNIVYAGGVTIVAGDGILIGS